MELPQPHPYTGPQGNSTHDFLSLYSQVQDPIPPQGGYIKTHDFLGKNGAKEESTAEIIALEKPPLQNTPPLGEHVLPGGIGTYSISHISQYNQRAPKPEVSISSADQIINAANHNEENSNCSSQTGSGFTLWEESAVKKGKTGKENHSGSRNATRDGKIGGGQSAELERPTQSSSSIAINIPNPLNGRTTFTSRSSSLAPSPKKQSFMDMLKSVKAAHDEDYDDEEDYTMKKEPSPQLQGDLTVKVGSSLGKTTDQKPNTPRSKHSATEQRRRSKINDRFHMLRDLIPHSDQKRDKASFLLEVIEYIQYLQDKVHKYEGPYQGWNQELPKLMPWRNKHSEGCTDPSRDLNIDHAPTMAFVTKIGENDINFSPTSPLNEQKAIESEKKTATNLKAIDHHFGLANQALLMQTNAFPPGGSASMISPTPGRIVSDLRSTISQPQSHIWQSMPHTPDCDSPINKLKEQDLAIESGVISISTVYSQGLLNTLTQALQNSGVDLSQANISVQIDLGKRANSRLTASTSAVKDDDTRYKNQFMASSRGVSSGDEPDQERKRLRTS